MTCTATACALILTWFAQHPSYDASHREAILTYMAHESHFQQCVDVRSGGFLFQWAGVRRRWIKEKYAGVCPTVPSQLDFMDWELRTYWPHFFATPPQEALAYFRYHFGQGRMEYEGQTERAARRKN